MRFCRFTSTYTLGISAILILGGCQPSEVIPVDPAVISAKAPRADPQTPGINTKPRNSLGENSPQWSGMDVYLAVLFPAVQDCLNSIQNPASPWHHCPAMGNIVNASPRNQWLFIHFALIGRTEDISNRLIHVAAGAGFPVSGALLDQIAVAPTERVRAALIDTRPVSAASGNRHPIWQVINRWRSGSPSVADIVVLIKFGFLGPSAEYPALLASVSTSDSQLATDSVFRPMIAECLAAIAGNPGDPCDPLRRRALDNIASQALFLKHILPTIHANYTDRLPIAAILRRVFVQPERVSLNILNAIRQLPIRDIAQDLLLPSTNDQRQLADFFDRRFPQLSTPVTVTAPRLVPAVPNARHACHAIAQGGNSVVGFGSSTQIESAIIHDLMMQPQLPPAEQWTASCGPELLALVGPHVAAHPSLAKPVIILATRLGVQPAAERAFAETTGFAAFCVQHATSIRSILEEESRKEWTAFYYSQAESVRVGLQTTFAVNLPLYCPEILSPPEATSASFGVFAQRIYWTRLQATLARGSVYAGMHIQVSRNRAFRDAVDQLLFPTVSGVRVGIAEARLQGEQAIGPGVIREWFSVAAQDLEKPELNVFQAHIPDGTDPPYTELAAAGAGGVAVTDNTYIAIGRFLALSLLHREPIGLVLPVYFYARMLQQRVSLDDFAEDEPGRARMYRLTLDATDDSFFSAGIAVPNETGGLTDVNMANRERAIDIAINSKIPASLDRQFNLIRDSFLEILPQSLFTGVVNATGLKAAIAGELYLDPYEFAAGIEFHGFGSGPQVGWLQELIRGMNQNDLHSLLHYITSKSRLSRGGAAAMNPRIKIVAEPASDSRLPEAHTCFFEMNLPLYSTQDILNRKVTLALQSQAHMGMV